MEMIQCTLILLGNASNYVSQCRRDDIIFKLRRQNLSFGAALSSVCQPDEKHLFGKGVQRALTERADSVVAMTKVSMKLDAPRTPEESQFFRRGCTSITAGGPARC